MQQTQRKCLERIEYLRLENEGKIPLNPYNNMEQWNPTLYSFFENNATSQKVYRKYLKTAEAKLCQKFIEI